ncbi:lantibiotic dehydratase [Streptomyces sp. NPDC015032]|uniref:lantibiotic dehydratase n=1 Tax=Streptomyces sp. NPDC015032 TaxID=3364937 RepID=UPI0036FA9FAC
MTRNRLLQRGDVLLLRAAALPLHAQRTRWPSIDEPEECRRWLTDVWAEPTFAAAVRAASPLLAEAVDQILDEDGMPPKKVRKAVVSVARYLLRATGRPTPFGLFAGVATARCGPALAQIGADHRPVARPDTLWLDHVRRDLQSRPDVLPHLTVQFNDLAVRHGDVLDVPLSGGRTASVRFTRPLAVALEAATAPVLCREITDRLVTMGGTAEQASRLVAEALKANILISGLSAPMTEHDPLGHILRALTPLTAQLDADTADRLRELGGVHQLLAEHDTTGDVTVAQGLRHSAEKRMSAVSNEGRARLSLDLRLDASVRIPDLVLDEAEYAADALLRLTRNQGEQPLWAEYHGVFWERYGAGSLVPVREAADLAAGAGLPADFPASLWTEPPVTALPRDKLLMAKAWQAAVTGAEEVRLTEADLDRLSADAAARDPAVNPHVEMGVRVYAADWQAVDRGDFTVAVRPAWSTGNLTGRFAATLENSGLREMYKKLPTLVGGALLAQLSFAPVHPHAENVARTPALLPYVIPVGEHRAPAGNVIPLDDLAVLSTSRRLHLVSLSRRRVVEPVVLHPLALEKQAPPIARFLALLGRGFATAWTRFDWGPLAAGVPYLPRIRYRKAILFPARWRLVASDLPSGSFQTSWQEALTEWTRTWKCPQVMELRDDDRTLRLDLSEPLHARILHSHLQRHGEADLTEAPSEHDLGWIGHAHEIVLPLISTRPSLPHPDVETAPVFTNRMLPNPGDNQQRWVQAKLFTHPSVMDQIISRRMPHLLDELGFPGYWFVRYRTPQEEDHLRVRIAAFGPHRHSQVLHAIARWAAQMQADALVSRLVFDGYRPEVGRYGSGAVLAAAEDVFVADSDTARYVLADLTGLDRKAVCAFGMIDVACGLLGDDEGTRWMSTTPAHGTGAPDVTRQVLHHIRAGGLQEQAGWTSRLDAAHQRRREALVRYAAHLRDGQLEVVLESLLHMHHNRLMGPDREAEAACRHAARQACRSVRERRVGE